MAFGSTQNSKVIGVFCLNTSPTSSPTLEHVEVCSSSMKSNIPIPLMKQNPNSTRQKTNFDAFIPNLSMVISEFEVTVSYEKLSWSSSLSNVRISHNKVENKSEITTDEIAISDDKGNVFIQQFKLNRRLDGVLTTWSHISIQSSTESLDMINIVRLKYLDIYQGIYKQRTYIEDTTLSIEISGGTMESTKYNLALHVQQISTKGQLISKCPSGVFKSKFCKDF